MKPKTSPTYFHFFENKTKPLEKCLRIALITGVAAGFVLIILLHAGVIRPHTSNAIAKSTPARFEDPGIAAVLPETGAPLSLRRASRQGGEK